MKRTLTAFALTSALALSLTACSSDDKDKADNSDATTSATSSSPADSSAISTTSTDASSTDSSSAESSSSAASGTGSYSAMIDGQPFKADSNDISCESTGDILTILVGKEVDLGASESATISATMKGNVVDMMSFTNVAGQSMSYIKGVPGTSADVKVDGKTYRVDGKGQATDFSKPGQPEIKPFQLEVTCP